MLLICQPETPLTAGEKNQLKETHLIAGKKTLYNRKQT